MSYLRHAIRQLLKTPGFTAIDPGVFALNAVIVAGAALLASLVPALRAAATDPASALR